MKALFHLPVLPPKNPRFEAYSQEITALSALVDGKIVHINPNEHLPENFPTRIPRIFYGLHRVPQLLALDETVDFHQIYNPDPYYFPVLRLLKKPIVYVISGRVSIDNLTRRFCDKMAAVAVYDNSSFASLAAARTVPSFRVQSGIDSSRFTHHPREIDNSVHLLMASAPWTENQFESKGIDVLLEAIQQLPRMKLTLLWRGVLYDSVMRRIEQLGITDRVTVIDEMVDVNDILGKVHGTIILANRSDIVKAYPHSLLDSLAAGKPIIVSRRIPIADYVDVSRTGLVVESMTVDATVETFGRFIDTYDTLRKNAEQRGSTDFDLPQMLDSYKTIYAHIASKISK